MSVLKGMLQTWCLNPLTALPISQGNAVHDSGVPELIFNYPKLELQKHRREPGWPSPAGEQSLDMTSHLLVVVWLQPRCWNQLVPFREGSTNHAHSVSSLSSDPLPWPSVTSAAIKAATAGCINFACSHLTSSSGKALSLLTLATSCQEN